MVKQTQTIRWQIVNILNDDLQFISKWAFNWKIIFNPDPSKPAIEILFSRKKPNTKSSNHMLKQYSSWKIILDEKLNFKQHIDSVIWKVNRGILVITKLRHILPRKSLVTTYKALLRPLLDYGDIIYGEPHHMSFCEKLEPVQYKAALPIRGTIKGTFRCNIYEELGIESLKARRWYRCLSCMFKITKKLQIIWLI